MSFPKRLVLAALILAPTAAVSPGVCDPDLLHDPAAPGLVGEKKCIDLGATDKYVMIAKTGVTNVAPSWVVGNIGVSPIDVTS